MSYRICTTHWCCHGNHLHNYTYTRRPTGASQPAACREERLAFLLLHHGEGDRMTDLHFWATTHSTILVPCLKLSCAHCGGLCSQTCEWLAKWAKACTSRTTYTSLTLASTLETVHVALIESHTFMQGGEEEAPYSLKNFPSTPLSFVTSLSFAQKHTKHYRWVQWLKMHQITVHERSIMHLMSPWLFILLLLDINM